jgi:tetratricopeptide (TPR) repeat protein
VASLKITSSFNAFHGTNKIIQCEYSISIIIRGEIILGFVKHLDSIVIVKKLEYQCALLAGCYLDEILGRATHEVIAMHFMNLFENVADEVVVIGDNMEVSVSQSDLQIYKYQSFSLLQKGIRAFMKCNFQEAYTILTKAIEKDGLNQQAYMLRGRVLRYMGEYHKAKEDFSHVIELDEKWSEGYRNMGNILLFQECYDKMMPYFDQAIKLAPYSSLAANNRGYAHILLGNYDAAISDCLRAIDLNPAYVEAHTDIATAYEKLGEVELAAKFRAVAEQIQVNHSTNDNVIYTIGDQEDYRCFYLLE